MGNMPKQRIFFRHTALIFLAIPKYSCVKSPCLAKKSLTVVHIAIYQTRPSGPSGQKLHFNSGAKWFQDKAEDAGGLSPVKDDNAVMKAFGPKESVISDRIDH